VAYLAGITSFLYRFGSDIRKPVKPYGTKGVSLTHALRPRCQGCVNLGFFLGSIWGKLALCFVNVLKKLNGMRFYHDLT
jgi:hypothetical protein